ncbi:MAG: SpoIIE family protein phosphatase [Oligoflexus sp.]
MNLLKPLMHMAIAIMLIFSLIGTEAFSQGAQATVDVYRKNDGLDFDLTRKCQFYRQEINAPVRGVAEFQPHELQKLSYEDYYSIDRRKSRVWCEVYLRSIDLNPWQGYLLLSNVLADYIDVFILSDDKVVEHYISGDRQVLSARKIKTRQPVFAIDFEPYKTLRIVIAISSNSLISHSFILSDSSSINQRLQLFEYINGINFGIVVALFCFNLILSWFSRESLFFSVILLCIPPTFITFCQEAYVYYYVTPDNPKLHHYILAATINFSLAISLIAGLNLLDKRLARWLRQLVKICTVLALIGGGAALLGFYQQTLGLGAILSIVGICGLVLLAAINWYHGKGLAAYLFITWLPIFIGASIMALDHFDWIDSSLFSIYSLRFAILVQLLLVSYIVAFRVYQESRKVKNKEQLMELEIQRNILEQQIQSSLIGFAACPRVQSDFFYEATENTGGDWFHSYYDQAHQRVYFFIGDVTGHGVNAALLTSLVSGAMEALMSYGEDQMVPEQILNHILSELNIMLKKQIDSHGMFMTMYAMAIDLNTYDVYYGNAGHHPAFLWQKGRIRTLLGRGSPLGLSSDLHYHIHHAQLGSHDLLIAYTDGLIEVDNSRGMMPIRKHLQQMLPENDEVHGLPSRIIRKLDDLYGKDRIADDRCLLALKLR